MAKNYGYTTVYSLADYKVAIQIPAIPGVPGLETAMEFTIGGAGNDYEGSCVGEIRVSRNNDTWTTEADPTGSWVHNKNLDRTGRVQISIRQVSDYIIKFICICQAYEKVSSGHGNSGIGITVLPDNGSGASGFAQAIDCFPVKIPDQVFGSTAQDQEIVFTSGRVTFTVDEP